MTRPTGTGAQLLAAARAASDQYMALCRIHVEDPAFSREERLAWFAESKAAGDEAQAAATALYRYFGSDQPTVEERAAWALLDPVRWNGRHS
jgi:hypothetical protein